MCILYILQPYCLRNVILNDLWLISINTCTCSYSPGDHGLYNAGDIFVRMCEYGSARVCVCVCAHEVYILFMLLSDNEAHTEHTINAAGSVLADGYRMNELWHVPLCVMGSNDRQVLGSWLVLASDSSISPGRCLSPSLIRNETLYKTLCFWMNPNVKMLLEKEVDITADPLPPPYLPPHRMAKKKYCWEHAHIP